MNAIGVVAAVLLVPFLHRHSQRRSTVLFTKSSTASAARLLVVFLGWKVQETLQRRQLGTALTSDGGDDRQYLRYFLDLALSPHRFEDVEYNHRGIQPSGLNRRSLRHCSRLLDDKKPAPVPLKAGACKLVTSLTSVALPPRLGNRMPHKRRDRAFTSSIYRALPRHIAIREQGRSRIPF